MMSQINQFKSEMQQMKNMIQQNGFQSNSNQAFSSTGQANTNSMSKATDRRKRNRKNSQQMKYLMLEYIRDPNWTKDTCIRVSRATGLTESQVYKWGWDQKNKKLEDLINNNKLSGDQEFFEELLKQQGTICSDKLKSSNRKIE